ncbi:MAG TPA: F0F1 ATP synthase subunit A, partial [Subdoligranulum variabile]|nr:F0F1 ATP synthase subunit A [Subdoligranulum variabile]
MNKLEGFKETLIDALANKTAFTIPVLGGIPISSAVLVTWIIMAFWIIVTLLATRNLKVRNPGKFQIVLESGVELLNGFAKQTLGPHWRPFAPYLGSVALYIGLANIISIFGLTPPTKDVNVTAALALMSLVLIYGAQFRYNGLARGMKRFAEPMPLL